MKNRQKWLIITAITVIFGLVVAACDNGGNTHTHDWGGWTETTAATCSAKGVETRTCSGCGETQTQDNDIDPDNHDLQPVEGSKLPTCTELGYGGQKCVNCVYTVGVGDIPMLDHTVSSWSFKTAANCITSEIEKGTCTVCGGEDTRYSPTNHALGHTLNPLTKVSVSFGVFEDLCTRCNEIHAHEFTYEIGDEGPAGGIIFYVADGEDGRPDGITIQGYTGATGTFAEYTAYYLEAAPANEPSSVWGASGTSIANVTTFTSVGQNNTLTIGVGRKDTQTIVNNAAFAALTDTAAQRCTSKNFGGKTDWFLPSLGELNEMYKARVAGVTGIPTTGVFWSSSQHSNDGAWYQYLNSGFQGGNLKSYDIDVRAIRAF